MCILGVIMLEIWIRRLPIAVALVLLTGAPRTAHGARLTISSATVSSTSEEATLCVTLRARSTEKVAGTENELVWNGNGCATMLDGSCRANPAHGKDLTGSLSPQRDFTYKALILSFGNTDPIPSGELYCCDFVVDTDSPGTCCDVSIQNAAASDPDGQALALGSGGAGRLCLAADAGAGSGGSFGGVPSGGNPSGGGSQVQSPRLGGGADDAVAGGGAAGAGSAGGSAGGGPPGAAPAGGGPVATGGFVGRGDGSQPAPAVVADLAPQPDVAVPLGGGNQVPVPADPGAAVPRPAPEHNEGVETGERSAVPAKPKVRVKPKPKPKVKTEKAAAAPAVDAKQAPPQKAEPVEEDVAESADAEASKQATTGAESGAGGEAPPHAAHLDAVAGSAKPSPRDVVPARSGAGRPRHMPLDGDDGSFGCQAVRPSGAGQQAILLVPVLLMMLLRRRQRVAPASTKA